MQVKWCKIIGPKSNNRNQMKQKRNRLRIEGRRKSVQNRTAESS